MKRIFSTALIIGLAAGLNACQEVLEAPTKSSLDESVIFSTPSLAEGAVAGVIQSFAETNSYRGRYLVFYGVNTDTEVYNSVKNTSSEQARLSNYNTNVNNSQMNTDNNAWAKFYEGIERANLAIRGLKTYGNVEQNKELGQLLGEMLTLRAVVYSDLLKGWGDVPARFEPVNSETVYLERSDRDVIYKQLLADLEEATELLAWPNETAATQSTERVNKAFAKGLRARLALAAGGYGQRSDGTIRRSTDPDLAPEKMYAIAKKECLDVINSGTARLLGFEEVFRTFAAETNRAGLESLWEIPFSEGRGRVIFDLGVRHDVVSDYTGQNRGGTNGPNPLMYYEYESGDVRRDVTCVPYKWVASPSSPKGVRQEPNSLGGWYFGKYRYEWLNRRVTSTNDDGLNWMYMRYADVILMAAEAINELDGPAAAAPYLKMIRDRAFPGQPQKVAEFMQKATAGKDAFFQAIVDERALEFTGEMLRKGDLIRWNLLSSKLAEARTKLEQLDNRQGRYASLPARIYYTIANDGETAIIYGLNFGDKDETGAALGYEYNKAWTLSASNDVVKYWDALYLRNPDQQQFWPIWQVFLDASNGKLTNEGYNFN